MPSLLKTAGWALLFWAGAGLVQEFNRKGIPEAVVLLCFLGGALAMMRIGDRPAAGENAALAHALLIGIVVLVVCQLGYAGARLWHPRVGDITHATWAGSEAMLSGQNPYTALVDRDGLQALGPRFQGFKYLPLMGWAYVPLGLPFGDRGLLATTLLMQVATAVLVWRLARAMGNDTAGRIAVCLYLAVPLVALQAISKADNDPVAVVPLLLALLCWERRPGMAGLLVGLSIAAKLTPGVLFLACLLPALPAARWRYALGVAVGCIPVLPYALEAPRAFFDNIVAFNALRSSDASSWLHAMPADVAGAAHAALGLLLLAVAIAVWRRPPTLFVRCGLCVVLMLAALLLGPSPHQNYHLWWLPVYCVLVSVWLAGGPRPDAREAQNVGPLTELAPSD
ncbi:MAG TPA: glycosyltransferase 87 family protein [Stellaceae bacterium]|nr:glycosyltransferase 87 family protein [Stellaceae bacterium]